MYRFDIINHLIKINNFKNYLEIGVFDGECLKQIVCENKDGVDPGSENGLAIGVNYRLSSDDFFQQHSDKIYDLIFIDGLHHSQQVDLDLKNALRQTRANGIIVLHDCNPTNYEMTTIPRKTIQWNGDVYKSILKFMQSNKDHTCYTVDTDWGVTIILKNKPQDYTEFKENYDKALNDWNFFDINRTKLLNLITTEEFYKIFDKKHRPTLKTNWNSGFFSCCTDKLRGVLQFHNQNNVLPYIDSSEQWELYKDDGIENIQQWWGGTVDIFNKNDITDKFFKIKEVQDFDKENFSANCITPFVCNDDQYCNYHEINYNYINKITNLYFDFANSITKLKKKLISKYKIQSNKTIAVCYRGNDKFLETNLPSYQDMLYKILEVKSKNPNHKILIQSDEIEFCDFIIEAIPDCFLIEETKKINKTTNAVQYTIPKGSRLENAQTFLSVMSLISECSNVILNSGNVGLWICLFRKNSNNVSQYLHKINSNTKAEWLEK
jgi:hypothetical protein